MQSQYMPVTGTTTPRSATWPQPLLNVVASAHDAEAGLVFGGFIGLNSIRQGQGQEVRI